MPFMAPWRVMSPSRGRAVAFTLLETLVVISLVAALIAFLLPALAGARKSARMAQCVAHAYNLTACTLSYVHASGGKTPVDHRAPAMRLEAGRPVPREDFPYIRMASFDDTKLSWFWKLRSYLGNDRSVVDCPLQDDIFKYGHPNFYWWCDYYINRFALNSAPESSDDPARAMLFTHPNWTRASTLYYIAEILSYGTRPDLEDEYTGSLPFGFLDGHAARVITPQGNTAHRYLTGLPEVLLRWGSPPNPPGRGQQNRFVIRSNQVSDVGQDFFPPPNSETEPLDPAKIPDT